MGDQDQDQDQEQERGHHHHQQHRPQRLWVPPRSAALAVPPSPSKSRRLASVAKGESESGSGSGSSLLVVLFFSLRSLYSLLPFLRSSPSFSLFPFSFLLSLLSFALTLSFYLLSPPRPKHSLSLSSSHRLTLAAKSALLALVFLLRFQALRYCGTASMILAELTGSVLAQAQPRTPGPRALLFLSLGLLILSFGWDRIQCFPFSPHCLSFFPLLLPFLAGFLSRYQLSIGSSTLKHLGHKRLRLLTLLFATLFLFPPALLTFSLSDSQHAFPTLAWPLANTVVFGVLLNQSYGSHDDHRFSSFKHSQREFLFTFGSTLVLELFYFPELSLWGLLLSGLLLYLGVRDLDPFRSPQEGLLSDAVMKPIRHVLSERKSRKIALFLLINAAYMVVEFAAGFMSNSLGLISDACHMLFDCAALAIGLYASYISRLPANNHYNYGRGRFEVLSGYANAVFLVLVGALIVVESFERILDPQEISTSSLLVVSVGGLLVNVVGLVFFHEEHHHAHGHGWSGGSCSHSHPHSELHSHHTQHLHDHNTHSHQHGSNQEFISIPSDCPDDSCYSDHGHHHDHSGHESKHHGDCLDNHSIQNLKHHDARCHDLDLGHHHHHHDHFDHESKHHDEDNHDIHSFKHHDTAHCHEASHVHQEHGHHGHRHIDHNMEGIFLHVLADTMGSVGVVISTLLIKYKGWLIADPACSIFISILIVSSVIPLLKNSAEVLLQRVPRTNEHNLKDALSRVLKIRGVYGIQKFHSWSFTNTDVVGTMHLHVSMDTDKISAKSQVLHLLHDAGIKDVTLQVECVG
ncbi:hypothetical protein Fmac_004717 [Flemingia macrophylla]|uniref:Cation efflux protein transmembrane domain-containing protein n=1 Tax=Flemingia macrophylla TaxID=520843 RepID=A0ABD1N5P2_9FABA